MRPNTLLYTFHQNQLQWIHSVHWDVQSKQQLWLNLIKRFPGAQGWILSHENLGEDPRVFKLLTRKR